MSEWVWAKIAIGGTISRPQLTRLVEEFGVSPVPAGLNPPETVRFLELEDSAAHYGQFEALEAYLVEQAIPFDRASDGTYEHSPEFRKYRPSLTGSDGNGSGPLTDPVMLCNQESRPMVLVADIAQALAETKTRKELAARLTELCGLDVPDLPPLSVTGTIRMTDITHRFE